jgi:hypothetical protein
MGFSRFVMIPAASYEPRSFGRGRMKIKIIRIALGSALAMAFAASAGPAALGGTAEDCHKKLEADRARIDRDAAKHGDRSPQVNRDLDRMDADRNWCRDHHADWDHTKLDVGIYVRP